MIRLIYYLHLFHSRKDLSKEQQEGSKACGKKCNTCTDRLRDNATKYNKYNTRKGHKKKNHVVTTFRRKEDLIDELKRRCIMRKCDCTFNLVGGKPTKNGCPEEQLCKKHYTEYFTRGQLRKGQEETWKNAEKKNFTCPNCNAPFNYEEDRDYHCTNVCQR